MLTPIRFYKSDDIDEINRLLWTDITTIGNHIEFGDVTEIKPASEVFAVFQIYGKAISRLYKGDLPKGWIFGKGANQEYIKTMKCSDKGDQPYTYSQCLQNKACAVEDENGEYHVEFLNQLGIHQEMLKESIKTGIQSNRIWGDVGSPEFLKIKSPMCFRWWQLRTSERNKVSARIGFRSNDAGNAYMANLGALIRLLVDNVINPVGGQLEEVILVATSEHVYDYDRDFVEALVNEKPKKSRWGLPI